MKNSLQLTAIIFTLVAFTFSANAQKISKKVYDGYVVLTNQDRLDGQISMLTPALNEVKVVFIGKDGKKQTFKAQEVASYAFQVSAYDKASDTRTTKWITYVRRTVDVAPIAFGSKDVLLQQPVEGSINLFNHFIERPSDKQQPLVHTYYVENANGLMVSLDKTNYKEVLNNMTTDYPELQAKIGTRGYGFKYVEKIVTEYNAYQGNVVAYEDLANE